MASVSIPLRSNVRFERNSKGKLKRLHFDEVQIDGKVYWLPTTCRRQVRDIRAGNIICDFSRSTYSDHSPMFSVVNGLKICTFNACLTVMALRLLQKVCNSSGKWQGMTTGDTFLADESRRIYMTEYIIELISRCDILLLQEIDNDICGRLLLRGVTLVYEEESVSSPKGGNAICTIRPDILLLSPEPVYDYWKENRKLIGIYCVAEVEKVAMSVGSFHFDSSTPVEKVKEYSRHQLSIMGGDFNKNVDDFLQLNTVDCQLTRVTLNDESRKNTQHGTIDAIFQVDRYVCL